MFEIPQRRLLTPKKKQIDGLLPKGYKRVSHLESVGGAYIDLNLPHADYPSFKGSFCTTENTPDAFRVLGMVAANSQARCYLESTKTQWGTHSNMVAYYAQYYMGAFYAKRGEWHTFEIGSGYATIDGETKTNAKNFRASARSHIMFGYNNNGTMETSDLAMGDFQAFTGLDNPMIARDLICCVRESAGEVGYYDLNNSVCPLTSTPFYCNAGSGYFIAGDEI